VVKLNGFLIFIKSIGCLHRQYLKKNGKNFLAKKLSAATLIEVIISLVIIMAVFVAALALFTKVSLSNISITQIKVTRYMEQLATTIENEKDYSDEILEADSVFYDKKVAPYMDYPDLLLLTITAEQNEKQIGQLKRIIRKEKTDAEE
jgi:Tfp pilus assembly protein PilV